MTKLSVLLGAFITILGATGCDNSGTCEFKYDQASRDNSIPAGLEVCQSKSVADKCSEPSMRAATQGLKTSGYTFTKGAKCEERGYKDCSGGRGFAFYKTCPK